MPVSITLKAEEVQPGIMSLQFNIVPDEPTDHENHLGQFLIDQINPVLQSVRDRLANAHEVSGPTEVVGPAIDSMLNGFKDGTHTLPPKPHSRFNPEAN